MEQRHKTPKRPMGWTKPYWDRTGLYVCVTLVSFLVSLVAVRFGCGVLLQAAIDAQPVVWRVIELALDILISVGVTVYFASREGYAKRAAKSKITAVGGGLFVLAQAPIALVCQGAALVTGPMATSLAQLLYFGNASMYTSDIDSAPVWWTLACMAITEGAVLIPAMVAGERLGAKAYAKEQAALIGEE